MELFERVDEVIRIMGKSRTKLAQQLDIRQTTFNSWFSQGRQDYLWPVLFKVLELYPRISREWLFFGEGEVVKSDLEVPSREKELLLKIEQLSGLLVKMENQWAPR